MIPSENSLIRFFCYYSVAAVLAVRNDMSLRNAERQYGVSARTVGRRKLLQDKAGVDPAEVLLSGRPVISKDEEQQLETYLLTASDRLIGLCLPELLSLAFDYAQRLSKPHKFNSIQQKAGYQWIHGFMRRNPIVSVRIPQATSLYRAKAFTKETVDVFYDNLHSVMTTYNFGAESIWNMDETGLSIVQKPLPVIARKRNQLSRKGKYISPFLVLPGRKWIPGKPSDSAAHVALMECPQANYREDYLS
ncbi:unnamed protein product [Allacma fusca]|uniref:Uncharacterized protein n=1 Tax=Allacma fusca TaxID=39272 RepID=A0A8J2NZL9_9HEXA|nr:unnamed protein product [Allacma fusca]